MNTFLAVWFSFGFFSALLAMVGFHCLPQEEQDETTILGLVGVLVVSFILGPICFVASFYLAIKGNKNDF